MADCVFCRIVKGEIPCSKLMEDEHSLAFMDIGPINPGHALLIPKKHYERLTDMPGALVAEVTAHLPRLARAVVAATNAEGFNIFQTNGACSGQVVPHVHFHVIPRRTADGKGWPWRAEKYPAGEMEKMHARILEALKKA
jgi:histidine triad (HIT) family protein